MGSFAIASHRMEVTVLLFGPHAGAAGARSVRVQVDQSATCDGVLAALAAQHEALRGLLAGSRIAVNARFVSAETLVTPADELALIALVGGG